MAVGVGGGVFSLVRCVGVVFFGGIVVVVFLERLLLYSHGRLDGGFLVVFLLLIHFGVVLRLFFQQVRRHVILSVLFQHLGTIHPKPLQHAPTFGRSATALKGRRNLGLARFVIPTEFRPLGNFVQRPKIVGTASSWIGLVGRNAQIGLATVIDQNGRQVHRHVGIVIGLDGMAIGSIVRFQGRTGKRQVAPLQRLTSINAVPLVVGLNDIIAIFVQ
mmetsp:Transcript_28173/g.77428  ORF Transcript_28173/g.77428 Transcript_28173/m.77428 type:complete len:217 (-) Transcript_28173:274-924(-)